jgi:quercetin dioxygenase-like cupin family protein
MSRGRGPRVGDRRRRALMSMLTIPQVNPFASTKGGTMGYRAPRLQAAVASAVMTLLAGAAALGQSEGTGGRCVPLSERAGRELGCFIIATQVVGQLGSRPVFWHLTSYPTRAVADAAKGPGGAVVESLGKVWLFTIAEAGWRPAGGEHVAEVGPLPVDPSAGYTAQYMEAIFRPGMKSVVHRHSGPEAWYTLTGETCLETPEGTMVGRAGGQHVIVPGGPPMELTATGTELRRALVLILHDSTKPASSLAPDWTPKGLCKS